MARRYRRTYRQSHSHRQSQSHQKFPFILVAMLIAGCVSAVVVHLSAAGASTTVTATAVADAFIDSAHPTTADGSGPWVSMDNKPSKYGYFKFNVTVPNGETVSHADFRCSAGSANAFGAQLWTAPTDWDESTITWANAPMPDFANAPVGQTGPVSTSSYASVDVTSAISGSGT